MNIRDQVKAQAMQNTDKAQQRQKKSYDVKHQPLRFKASKGGKLEGAWSGPFSINRVLAKGLYMLRNEDGTMLKTSFNSSRLMIYYHLVKWHPNTNTTVVSTTVKKSTLMLICIWK